MLVGLYLLEVAFVPCTTLFLKILTSKKGFISCDLSSLNFPGPRTVNLVNTDLYGLLRLWYSVIVIDGWGRQVGDLKGKYFLSSKEIVTQAKRDNGAVVKPGRLDGRAWGDHIWMILLGQSKGWVAGIIHGWETYRTKTWGQKSIGSLMLSEVLYDPNTFLVLSS